MKSTLLMSLVAAAAPALVSAHGFVHQVTINGQAFLGNVPNAKATPSAIRQINDVGPVKGADNADVNCGHSAQLAAQDLTANPGDKLTFDWRGGDLSNWPHNTGPMLTYMASCGSTTCDKFVSANAKWFKIDQLGRAADKTWVQQELMNGGVANVTLPANLAPGNYLIRHEIIALHLANSMGGAEFYPSCTQLTVGGSGTGAPTAAELVSLPGAYSDSDPGIFDPNVFDTDAPYTFPGPPIAKFVTQGASSSSGNAAPAPNTGPNTTVSAQPPSATSGSQNSPSSGSSGSCRLKRKPVNTVVRPRHYSRIMRNLHLDSTFH